MTIEARALAKPRKSAAVIKLLWRSRGATSAEMMTATGWQSHSVRAFLTGLRKKGHVLTRQARKSGEAAYRLMDSARAQAATADGAPSVAGARTRNGGSAVDATTAAPAA